MADGPLTPGGEAEGPALDRKQLIKFAVELGPLVVFFVAKKMNSY